MFFFLSLGMRPVERYKRNYRRFTWNNRIAYGAPVLTGRRDTGKGKFLHLDLFPIFDTRSNLLSGVNVINSFNFYKLTCR